MAKSRVTIVAFVLAFGSAVAAVAQPAAGVSWMPPFPGNAVQSQYVAFNDESSTARSRAVVSKKLIGSGNGLDFYQWYLSIYEFRRGAYRLRYESPGNGGPLSRVTQANGAKMWFPVQDVRVVGAAALMRAGVQQLVVASHETGADCGGATVTIFATKPGGSIGPVLTIENPCDLDAKVAPNGASVELVGPYYGPKAPLCCPTKARASAMLHYRDGRWVESPNYFKIE